LVVQTGHSDTISSVTFSPDGRVLASGSWDNSIKLWDAATGTELRTLKGYTVPVRSVAFSPDGRTLATAENQTVRLWDAQTGAPLRVLKGHSGWVNSVAFSPDGKTLASGDGDQGDEGTVRLWRVATGASLRTLEGHYGSVRAVAFSPDGKRVASGGEDRTVVLWDATTGEALRSLEAHSGTVNAVAFSPDGRVLASGGDDRTVRTWDAQTGAELRALEGHNSSVNSLAFGPDAGTLASCDDDTVRLWDARTGAPLRTLVQHSHGVRAVAFSRDGKTFAVGSNDHTIKLWDAATGGVLRALKGHTGPVSSIAISPDGRTLASGSTDYTVRLWDVSTGAELHALEGHSSFVDSVAFSPDGRVLASGGWDNNVRLWDAQTGAPLRVLEGHTGSVGAVAFSPDGRTLASGSSDNTIKLWRVADGAELRTLKGHTAGLLSVAFSPDGKTLATGGNDYTTRLWDAQTGAPLRTLRGHAYVVISVAFSPDGRTLATGSQDRTVKLWNVATGAPLRTLKGHYDGVYSVAFSLNGKYLLSGSVDTTLKLWEAASGRELASLSVFDERDWMVTTPEGLFDGSPAAWDKIIWRFNRDTFDYAPVEAFFREFYYPGLLPEIMRGAAPPPPDKDLSQIDIRQPTLKITEVEERAPDSQTPARADAPGAAPANRRTIRVRVEVTDNTQKPPRVGFPPTGGAQDVRLFRNGALIRFWPGDAFSLGRAEGCEQKGAGRVVCEAEVPLVAGENRVTAYAFNHDSVKSRDAELPRAVVGADALKRGATMYVLAVGVDRYADERLNLRLAGTDAEDFGEQVRAKQEEAGGYERRVVITLKDTEATKANVMHALARLASKERPPLPSGAPKKLEEFEHANANDAVVVYFAGHGVAEGERFYLLTSDFGAGGARGAEELKGHGVSDEELEAAFEPIVADKLMMVIDACNSGQALGEARAGRGPMNSKGLAQLAYDKGMYILTAAQSQQAALEVERLGHGLLTYALVEEGLSKALAETNNDGQIVEREWLDYATERVPQLQLEEMSARKARDIVVDESDDAALPPEKRAVQRPRVFYRRELEAQPLVIARAQARPGGTPAR
jgi:WD40 repeat protein